MMLRRIRRYMHLFLVGVYAKVSIRGPDFKGKVIGGN